MSERKSVDFHVHFDPLDFESGIEVLYTAKHLGVTAVGLLAREQISPNLSAYVDKGRELGVEVIPGLETSTRINGKRVDLICLGFDYEQKALVDAYMPSQGIELKNNSKIASLQKTFLVEQGLVVDPVSVSDSGLLQDLLQGKITEKAIRFCELASDDGRNAQILDILKKDNNELWEKVRVKYKEMSNYVGNSRKIDAKFLYLLYFDFDKIGYKYVEDSVDSLQMKAVDVMSIVGKSKGVVLYSPEGSFDPVAWQKLLDLGIDGIMGWHGGKLGEDKRQTDIPIDVIRDIRKRGLLVLGGSDYQQKDLLIGNGNGQMHISPRRLLDLRQYLKEKFNKDSGDQNG